MPEPTVPAGRTLVLALLVAVALALAGCEPDGEPDDAELTNGLLVLSGEVGAVTLEVRDETDPDGRTVSLPDAATTWVSAGRTNALLATLIDGRTFVSGPLDAEDPEWRLVEAVTVDDVPPAPPLYFGAWDPPGGAYVQLGVDFTAGGPGRVVVTDPVLGGATETPLGEQTVLAVPPAWIDDDRVVVLAQSDGEPRALIVDTPSGEMRAGPAGAVLFTTSADAATVASWRGAGTPVEVLPTEAWLDGGSGSVRIDPPADGLSPGVLALDRTGDRLAIVWNGPAGTPPRVTIHAAPREWSTVGSIELGDVEAAAVGWLR